MAIYLDNQTRPYLERKFKVVADTDFIGKRIQGMLKADKDRLESIRSCEHENAEFIGKENRCVKCSGNILETGSQRVDTPTKGKDK